MEQDQIIKNIKNIAPKHCDNCGFKYTPVDYKILRAVETSVLLHLQCTNCGNTYVINAFLNNTGIGSQRMPLVLDLENANEVEKFANMPPISEDDIVDLFNLLDDSRFTKNQLPKAESKSKLNERG